MLTMFESFAKREQQSARSEMQTAIIGIVMKIFCRYLGVIAPLLVAAKWKGIGNDI